MSDPRDFTACVDCGLEFRRASESAVTLCPLCADQHDAWTSALEYRWMLEERRMAHAILPAADAKKEVA